MCYSVFTLILKSVNTFTTQHIYCVPGDTKRVQYYTIYIQCWVNRVNNQKSVAEKLSSSYSNEVKLNRKKLTTIINAIYFLAKQGLALRGHDETDKTKNNGNFLELLNLVALHNSDLIKHLDSSNFIYNLHRSQDDIISLISQQIKSHIVNSISEFYSIIIDE
jgi:hypothetical protein